MSNLCQSTEGKWVTCDLANKQTNWLTDADENITSLLEHEGNTQSSTV